MHLLSSAICVQPVWLSGTLRPASRQRAQRRWMGERVEACLGALSRRSRASTSAPTPASLIRMSTSFSKPSASSMRSVSRPTASCKNGSDTCSSALSAARPTMSGDSTRTSPIRPELDEAAPGRRPRSNGIRANSIRVSASSSPTWRARPRTSSLSTTSAAHASSGSKRARAR